MLQRTSLVHCWMQRPWGIGSGQDAKLGMCQERESDTTGEKAAKKGEDWKDLKISGLKFRLPLYNLHDKLYVHNLFTYKSTFFK